MTRITICRSCPAGIAGLAAILKAQLTQAGIRAEINETDCMSGCARASTIAFRASGKTAYLFGDITEADLPDILIFLRLYAESADGVFADARPFGGLRMKALARIPA